MRRPFQPRTVIAEYHC